jgi:secretion/DNA translocation related CpaE-like protein
MTPAPALLVTCDETVLDDVLRLAAAAGVNLDVAHDTGSALKGWSSAAVLLVGADQARAVADRQPPRRNQVHLVGRGPARDDLFRAAVELGAQDVVELPAGEAWLVELLSDVADGTVGSACTIGVVAGSGGAGATTLACAVAITAASSGPALLADLDPFGPGLDRVVGFDDVPGIHWDALLDSRGRFGSRSLRAALPQRDRLAVITWGAGSAVCLGAAPVREVLTASQRGNDVVVVDLPRTTTEVVTEVVGRCDHVVVVVEPTIGSVASAGRLTAQLRGVNESLSLVVRGGSGAVPAERIAGILDLRLAVSMARQRRLAEQVDLGLGPVHSRRSPLARAAQELLRALTPPLAGAA